MDNKTGALVVKRVLAISVIALGTLSFKSNPNGIIDNKIRYEESIDDTKDSGADNMSNEQAVDNNKEKMDGYIILPNYGPDSLNQVGYRQEIVEDGETITYEGNGLEYRLDRILIFYTDKEDPERLCNCFSGRFGLGEIPFLLSQENGQTRFAVYKEVVKTK